MTQNLHRRGAGLRRIPMLPSDALFLHAEEALPEFRPQIAGLLILDRAPDHGRYRASLRRLMMSFPRLRQRVAESPLHLGFPQWEDDPRFDVDYHVREVVLPPPGSWRRLLDFAGSTLVAPLDHLRPLWEVYLIEGLKDKRAACLFKIHHSVVDGVGSMALFEALTQSRRAAPVALPRGYRPHDDAPRSPGVTPETLWEAAGDLEAALEEVARAALHPLRFGRQIVRAVGTLGEMIRDFNAHAITDPLADPRGGVGRRLDTVALSLPRLRRLKEVLGVTLNDVMLTAVAGAVGRYHERCGAPVRELECVVPVNLRGAQERELGGNRVGAFVVPLPVGEPDPLQRLRTIRRQTTVAKAGGSSGSASQLMMQALAFVPSMAFRAASQTVRGKLGLLCTNVPGPRTPRYLGGAKVEAIYPFLPPMFGMPLTVALLSYGDAFAVGIDTDSAVTRPQLLPRYLEEALDDLERRALSRHMLRRPPHHAQGASTKHLGSIPAA